MGYWTEVLGGRKEGNVVKLRGFVKGEKGGVCMGGGVYVLHILSEILHGNSSLRFYFVLIGYKLKPLIALPHFP